MALEEILKLPFEIQFVLASGYLSYRLSVTGLDRSYATIDKVFQILTFGIISYLVYDFVSKYTDKSTPIGTSISMGASIVVSLLVAAIWRKFGRTVVVSALRKSKITRENFFPSTWDHIIQAPSKWVYVSVACEDGIIYESDLSILPDGLPFDGIDLDSTGNIAIFVTRTIDSKGNEVDHGLAGAVDKQGFANVTYIPSSKIIHVTISVTSNVTLPEASSESVV